MATVLSTGAARRAIGSEQVCETAEAITVQIDSADSSRPSHGSGVLMAEQDGLYYILTAGHVVGEEGVRYAVTPPGSSQSYLLDREDIIRFPVRLDLDMAIVTMDSNNNYETVGGNIRTTINNGADVTVSGWPTGLNAPRPTCSPGQVSNRLGDGEPSGYNLIYNGSTRGGMSGGPILNDSGELVGIHAGADRGGGFYWGITIDTFLENAPSAFEQNAFRRMDNGDYDGAIADFTQGLLFQPDSDVALIGRAYAHLARGGSDSYSQAIDDANQVLRDSNNAEALLVLGAARAKLDRHNDAIEDLDRAQSRLSAPMQAVALSLQARSYADENRVTDANRTAIAAVEAVVNHPFAYLSRAYVHRAFGNSTGASNDEGQGNSLIASYVPSSQYEAAILVAFDDRFSGISADGINGDIAVSPPFPVPAPTPSPTPSPVPSPTPTPRPTPSPVPSPSPSPSPSPRPSPPPIPSGTFTADSAIERITASTGDRFVAIASSSGTVYLQSGASTTTLGNHSARIHDLAFNRDGTILASASSDGTVMLWDPGTRQLLQTLEFDGGRGATAVAFSNSGQSLLIGGSGGKVEQYNVADGTLIRSYNDGILAPGDLVVGLDGRHAVGSIGNTIFEWNIADGGRGTRRLQLTHVIVAMHYTPDGTKLIAGDTLGNITVIDPQTWQILTEFDTGFEIRGLALSPDGRTAIVGAGESSAGPGIVSYWDIDTGLRASSRPPQTFIQIIRSIAALSNGDVFAGDTEGQLHHIQNNN